MTIAIAIGVRDPRADRLAAANQDTSLVEAPSPAPVASVALDAAPVIDATALARDAAVVDHTAPVVDHTAPPAPVAHEPVKRPAPPDLAAAYGARRFAEVVATCAARTRLTAVEATACTVSACQRHDESHARRFGSPRWRRARAARPSSPVPRSGSRSSRRSPPKLSPPWAPTCKADPFACQD